MQNNRSFLTQFSTRSQIVQIWNRHPESIIAGKRRTDGAVLRTAESPVLHSACTEVLSLLCRIGDSPSWRSGLNYWCIIHLHAYMHTCRRNLSLQGFSFSLAPSSCLSCRVTLSGISWLLGFRCSTGVVMMFASTTGTAGLTSHRRATPSFNFW